MEQRWTHANARDVFFANTAVSENRKSLSNMRNMYFNQFSIHLKQ